mmetsp:Transcript_98394/g.317207  ORF Transcript_98394/g.317207 Transcript_98394/m.317207 type:complete len:210 (+) Transcript_98394:45-674(+)
MHARGKQTRRWAPLHPPAKDQPGLALPMFPLEHRAGPGASDLGLLGSLLGSQVCCKVSLGVAKVHEGNLVTIVVALGGDQPVLVEPGACAVCDALAHLALAHDHAALLEARCLAEKLLHLADRPVVPDMEVHQLRPGLHGAHDLDDHGVARGGAELRELDAGVREQRLLEADARAEDEEVAPSLAVGLLLLDPLAAGPADEELARGGDL